MLVMLIKLCTWMAKTRAIPSLHRDIFLAKVTGSWSGASSGNVYSLNRRAVSKNAAQKIGSAPYLDKFRMTSKLCSTLTEKPTRILLRDSLVIIRKSLYQDRLRRSQFLYLDKLLTHFY